MRRIIGLVLWLIGGLAVAAVYTWVNSQVAVRMGLGWAVRPGWLVLFFVSALGVLELRTVRLPRVIQILGCLVAAILLEYLFLPRPADSFIGIALTLLAMSILFNSAPRIRVAEVLLLLVSSYIQAVCFYNMFLGGQMMNFFKPGWSF